MSNADLRSTTGGGGGGSGTVTSVSVVTANGVSGSVANPNTTPSITLTLEDITPGNVTASGTVSGSNLSGTNTGDQNLFSTIAVAGQSDVVADSTLDTLTLVAGSNITITTNAATDSITIAASGGGGGGSGNSVTSTLAFGSSFTDKAQTVVTGQAWVTVNSEIITQVLTPSGVDPDEMRLLDFKPVISDLVAGDGFTVTLYSEPEAKGDYSVMCIGV